MGRPGTLTAPKCSAASSWSSPPPRRSFPWLLRRNSTASSTFPKLDYKLHASLKPMLKELGMRAAFEDADFSGLTPNGIVVNDVIHEAVIKVFEGGTIAAAATAVTFGDASVSLIEHTVRFDRPFFYLIVDQPTGQILFLGRVLDPSAG